MAERTAAQAKRVIAFVVYPQLDPLDLIGPLEVLSSLGDLYSCVTVGANREAVPATAPVALVPTATFAEVPHPFALVVPGGSTGTAAAMAGGPALDYIRSAAPTAEIVASVCTGALLLGAAGLLEGRRATTHWTAAGLLERQGARYVRERWVEDGKILTAAGVSAGIDMALHLAARLTDEGTAKRVQALIEYDPAPPFGGLDWSQLQPMQEQLASIPSLEEMAKFYQRLARG